MIPQNHMATLEELTNGDPSETLTERRYTALDADTNPLVVEYRTADRARDWSYEARLRRIEELAKD
jgi:hypothetical protein